MSRLHAVSLVLVVILSVVVLMKIFSDGAGIAPTEKGCSSQDARFTEWVETVRYCWQGRDTPQPVSVQLLFDSSGSMNGFAQAVPRVQRWMQQAVSGLRISQVETLRFRACYFNQSIGISNCQGAFGPFEPFSSTNLHEAIQSAREFDLTVIATDGVAATGAGTGDCAAGVDTACVAKSMRDVIRNYVSIADPGIWLIPTISTFDGVFYSEQQVPADTFFPDRTVIRIQEEVGQRVRIDEPFVSEKGELNYRYQGPKTWFLLIIARTTDLGRAAVRSLWNQMSSNGITSVSSYRDWNGGVGAVRAVEVFPGVLPKADLVPRQIDNSRNGRGTIGVKEVEESLVKLACEGQRGRNAKRVVEFVVRPRLQHTRCVEVGLLMPLAITVDTSDSKCLVTEPSASWTDREIHFSLECDSAQLSCTSPARVVLKAPPIFADFVECLLGESSESCGERVPVGHSANLLQALSATVPHEQPHRVFGLLSILQQFLEDSDRLVPVNRTIIGEVQFCVLGEP